MDVNEFTEKLKKSMNVINQGKSYQGISCGGKVSVNLEVTAMGKVSSVKSIKIDKELKDEVDNEILEDFIVAAFNDALTKSEAEFSNYFSEFSSMFGDIMGKK